MLTKIIARLKTESVKNVVTFGVKKLPEPPYVVVKPETAPGGRRFRVIVHFEAGQQIQLEDYMRTVLALLSEYQDTSRHGCVNRLGRGAITSDIVTGNRDDSISMEAAFLMPTHSF